MNRTGLIVVSNLSRLTTTFQVSRQHVFGTLYVQLYVPKAAPPLTIPRLSEIVQSIYKSSLRHCNDLDVRVLIASDGRPVKNEHLDVLMLDSWMPKDEITCIRAKFSAKHFINFGQDEPKTGTERWVPFTKTAILESCANNVVLGGTFDRLHVGHKLLLTEAAMRSNQRLVVGVTDQNMIKSKILCELLLPTSKRIEGVSDFLTSIDNTLKYEIVPIEDAFGPTRTDPNLDLLVVSKETFKGGEMCNEVRGKNQLNPLAVYCIDVIEDEPDVALKEIKISSSNQRLDLLGTRYRQPDQNSRLPRMPYIIGLIGGVCARLPVVSNLLRAKGATVIDCDKLAEQQFPNAVNRPHVLKRIKDAIVENGDQKVCVLQGNILEAAGLFDECHEIWSVIISRKEALKRLMDEEGKTENEASDVLDKHTDNYRLVEKAHVILSTNWDEEFNTIQVERAWPLVEQMMKN